MSSFKSILISSIPLIYSVLPAHASVVTLEFTGAANYVGSLAPYFEVGNPITFTAVYDTDTVPNTHSEFPFYQTTSRFELIDLYYTIEGTGGTWTGVYSDPMATILTYVNPGFPDNAGQNYQRITFERSWESPIPGVSNPLVDGRELSNPSLTFFTDISIVSPLPLSPTELPATFGLADWSTNPSSSGAFFYFIPGQFDDFMRFSITDVTVIPEPSSYALLFSALIIGLVLLRRRS